MAQNITLLGASYSDVPAVLLPKTGGGTARFDDASVTTATAADVASGKIFLANDGTITTGTASSGGGASNVVTGTFMGTTTGTIIDVNVNYSGNGYPIMIFVVPTGGMLGNQSYANLVKRYAIGYLSAFKSYVSQIPTYEGSSTLTQNQFSVCSAYKNSSSAADNYTRSFGANIVIAYGNSANPGQATQSLLFRDSKKFSVLIASSSYGYAANIEYTYYIMYSS